MLSAESTIPAEIEALNLPHIERVVVMGGAVLELAGIRLAKDIDLVMSVADRKALYESQPDGWQKIAHLYRRASDGSNLQITSLSDSSGRFDIWSHWYDGSRPNGRRHVLLDELRQYSTQHPAGFYVANLEYLMELKLNSLREKDTQDVELVEHLRRTGHL